MSTQEHKQNAPPVPKQERRRSERRVNDRRRGSRRGGQTPREWIQTIIQALILVALVSVLATVSRLNTGVKNVDQDTLVNRQITCINYQLLHPKSPVSALCKTVGIK